MENYSPQFEQELRPVSVQTEAKKWFLVFKDCKTKKFFLNEKNEHRALIEPEKPKLLTMRSFIEKVP